MLGGAVMKNGDLRGMKRLLVICFPTWGKENELHLDSSGRSVVLAPDEMTRLLETKNIAVDVASLDGVSTDKPLMRSGKPVRRLAEIVVEDYDAYWHMFRDPTQPEVLTRLDELRLDYGGGRVINDVRFLKDHHKWRYLPVLAKHGIGPRVFTEYDHRNTMDENWSTPSYGASVAKIKGRRIICTSAFNNNRGDYPQRRSQEQIFVEYLDNAASGVRSFFRVGFSMGRVTSGWLYCSDETVLTQKSGSCKHQIPFQIPDRYHGVIAECMRELGVDVCHLEGLFIKERLFVFDVNPYPTAHGSTLTPISEEVCRCIAEAIG
jgi:hypothetical protein